MTPQQLKNSILQMAMQGKLVEQRPEEGTGEELYQQIQKEKQKLINEGKIKKEKPLPKITEDEIPFEIPKSWKWVRFGNIVSYRMGKTPSRNQSKFWEDDIPWVSIADMPENGTVTDTKEKVSSEALNSVFKNAISPAGTLIMSFKLTVGRVSILGIDAVHNEAIISIFPYINKDYVIRNYLKVTLPYLTTFGKTNKAIKGFTLNSKSISNLLIPLPALAEQKRIVAKIEEIRPYLDRYEETYNRLETYNSRFPDDLKKSIFQEAIQGKLVPQDPNDEPASVLLEKIAKEKQKLIKEGKIKKQKPLPPIKEDEIPFEIPDSWKWVRLNNCLDVRDGTHDTPKYHNDGYPLVTSKNLRNGKIDFSTCKLISKEDYEEINLRSKVDQGDILFAMIGTIGNPVLYTGNDEFSIKNMALFKHIGRTLDMKYIYWYLQYSQGEMRKQASGGVQNFVSLNYLRNYLIPLPPLAEQHRIVTKLEELLPVIDKIKQK